VPWPLGRRFPGAGQAGLEAQSEPAVGREQAEPSKKPAGPLELEARPQAAARLELALVESVPAALAVAVPVARRRAGVAVPAGPAVAVDWAVELTAAAVLEEQTIAMQVSIARRAAGARARGEVRPEVTADLVA